MLQLIFIVIVGVTFSFGIINNPDFSIYEFFAGLSTEFIGWIVGVTVFQFFYDAKLSARRKTSQPADAPSGVADELLKCKTLLDSGAITAEEFEAIKKRLLTKGA